MRPTLIGFLIALSICSGRANADILFSLSPATSTITLGNKADFNVFIRSATEVIVGGYSLNVIAGPSDGPGKGTAGRFSSGTFSFLVGDPNQGWDLTTTPGQAYSTADTNTTGGTNAGSLLLANTTRLLGTLTLDTAGATIGTYSMSLDQLSAIQVNGNFIPGGVNGASYGGPVSFQITAVPEPASIALVGLAVGGFWLRRRCRRR
jgi:hypothetical protein